MPTATVGGLACTSQLQHPIHKYVLGLCATTPLGVWSRSCAHLQHRSHNTQLQASLAGTCCSVLASLLYTRRRHMRCLLALVLVCHTDILVAALACALASALSSALVSAPASPALAALLPRLMLGMLERPSSLAKDCRVAWQWGITPARPGAPGTQGGIKRAVVHAWHQLYHKTAAWRRATGVSHCDRASPAL